MLGSRTMFALIGLPTILAIVAAAPLPETSIDKTACQTIAATLPGLGSMLPPKPIVEAIAARPGSLLKLGPATTHGLVLKSTYGGSLNCQLNNLSQTTYKGPENIAMPLRFKGGEGALCGRDKVQLGTVNGLPALIEAAELRDNAVAIDIALRQDPAWTKSCRLTLNTLPHYRIVEQFCHDGACEGLESSAVQTADRRHVSQSSMESLADSEPPVPLQPQWAKMKSIAEARQLINDDLPTFDQATANANIHSFVDWQTIIVPITIKDDLLLGKIGAAGFGSHYGSDDLFAAYRMVGDRLVPVAGFYLEVEGRSLTGFSVGFSP